MKIILKKIGGVKVKDYMSFELKSFLSKRKTVLLIATLLGGAIWLFTAIHFQNLGDHEGEMYDELNETRLSLRSIETYYREDPENETLSDNIFQQQSLTASMYNGILFEEANWLYESGEELGELRLSFAELNQEELPSALFPPVHESKRQVAEYSRLQETNHDVLIDSRNTSDYLRLLMQYFGVFAFLFLTVFASDIGVEDFNHKTMVQGYPVPPISRMLTQVGIYLGSILAGSLFVLLLAGIFVSFFWGMSDVTYPMGIYSFGAYQAIPVWQGIIWFVLYYAFLALHIIVLSLLLNHLFKNVYATLVIMIFLYGISFLFPDLSATLAWTPLPYYQMTSVFQGGIAESGHAFAHLQSGIHILAIYSIITLVIMITIERRRAVNIK